MQGYNCQVAVDKEAQVIVATYVTQATNDKQQVFPLIAGIEANTDKDLPKIISADSGYFSEVNCTELAERIVDTCIATGRLKHGEAALGLPVDASQRMRLSRRE